MKPILSIWWNYYQNCLEFEGMKTSCFDNFNFRFSLLLFGVNNNICMEHKYWDYFCVEKFECLSSMKFLWTFKRSSMYGFLLWSWYGNYKGNMMLTLSNYSCLVWFQINSIMFSMVSIQFNSISIDHLWLVLKLKVAKKLCENEKLLDDYDYYGNIWT